MEGFLPLIEGFLAFALTMLALTTAVSAIVGVVHRMRRRRAQGLRDMVRVLYLTEIRVLLPASYFRNLEKERTVPPQDGWQPGFELRRDKAVTDRLRGRAEFISDMTLMPLPAVVEGLDVDEDYWKRKLESAERLAGLPLYKKALHPVRWFRRWRTLRCGLEALTDDEFKQRLVNSDAGQSMRTAGVWKKRSLASWEELETHLLKTFQTIGAASSETFARNCRAWSVAVGFVLAFGVNVDSIDLLNSYLTDPQLRADVLARSEDILAQKSAAPVEGGEPVLAETREQLAEKTEKLTRNAQELLDQAEKLASALPEDVADGLLTELEERRQAVARGIADVQSGLGELDEELTEARGKVQGTVRALTASFPVGWNRFPNCSATSPDLRCAGRNFVARGTKRVEERVEKEAETKARKEAEGQAAGETTSQQDDDPAVAAAIEAAVADALAQVRQGEYQLAVWRATIVAARQEAAADFSQWLAGVLLTGLFLGLGTPFWIQVVNAGLKLRRWVSDKGDGKEGDQQQPQAPAGPPAPAPGTGSTPAPEPGAAPTPKPGPKGGG